MGYSLSQLAGGKHRLADKLSLECFSHHLCLSNGEWADDSGFCRRMNVIRGSYDLCSVLWHLTVSCEYSLLTWLSQRGWKVTDKMESTERKKKQWEVWWNQTIQSWRQIRRAIRIAIIRYYGKARSLCYPTIETGSTRGNLMTHKSWRFWLHRASLSVSRHFSI